MSTVEELREERQRLEARQAEITGIDQAVADARRNEESAARAERRDKQATRQLVVDKQSQFGADLIETFEALKSFVARRNKLVRSRQEVVAAERAARAAGIDFGHSYLRFETAFFTSSAFRTLDNELRLMFGSGKILG